MVNEKIQACRDKGVSTYPGAAGSCSLRAEPEFRFWYAGCTKLSGIPVRGDAFLVNVSVRQVFRHHPII